MPVVKYDQDNRYGSGHYVTLHDASAQQLETATTFAKQHGMHVHDGRLLGAFSNRSDAQEAYNRIFS